MTTTNHKGMTDEEIKELFKEFNKVVGSLVFPLPEEIYKDVTEKYDKLYFSVKEKLKE